MYDFHMYLNKKSNQSICNLIRSAGGSVLFGSCFFPCSLSSGDEDYVFKVVSVALAKL